jgi:hypothetical protein
MRSVAVLGIVHPLSLEYLDDFFYSLANQSFKNFKLFLFGQNISKNDVNKYLEAYGKDMNITFEQLAEGLSIPKSIEFAIKFVKNRGYNIAVFTDTDDFFDRDYVELLSNALNRKCKISFCDTNIYFSNHRIITDYFQKYGVPDEIEADYLLDKNCIGFSNSAISLKIFDNLVFPEVIAVDWWFFSKLMLVKQLKAKFIKKSLVYYRQYEYNTAGFLNLNEERILNGLKVKLAHYKNLMFDEEHMKCYGIFKDINSKMSDDEFKERYVNNVLSKYSDKKYIWWEPILSSWE